MKVEFINKHTGCRMLVDESRVKEYADQGHTLAASLAKDEELRPVVEKKSAPKKRARN